MLQAQFVAKERVTNSILFYILGLNEVNRKEKNIYMKIKIVDFAVIIMFIHTVFEPSNVEVKPMSTWVKMNVDTY